MSYSKVTATARNCGHKKSPPQMPVELPCVKCHGAKRTQPNGRRRPAPYDSLSTFHFVLPDTQASRLLCRASISNYGDGRAKPGHPRREKWFCDRIGVTAIHRRIRRLTFLAARASRPHSAALFHDRRFADECFEWPVALLGEICVQFPHLGCLGHNTLAGSLGRSGLDLAGCFE